VKQAPAAPPGACEPGRRDVRGSLRRWHNWIAGLLLVVAALAACRLWPHPSLQQWKASSTAVYDDQGRLMRLTLASDDRYRIWVPLDRISPQLVDAVLLHEDQWFRWHAGFNPYGLARGAWVTYVRQGHRQGGSTITMQLARSLWDLNTRSLYGKALQVLRAIELELFYSKRQILEAYLNDVSFGHNIEGVGAASLAYFDKSAADLSLPEALALAVVPQDPVRRLRNPPSLVRQPDDVIINRTLTSARNRLYQRWLAAHPQDASLRQVFELPLTIRPLSRMPFEAPHAVEQLLAARRIEGSQADQVDMTIDLDLQHILERQIRLYTRHNNAKGISNAAAILVDTRDMGVKALVGSADYFNRSIQGQVNGTLAKRSPGSTLKPFIYALGFDQGVLQPQTVLRDVPTSFGPYTPENFDGHFLGPISATDALNRSRNIPAVWVASQLHRPDLYDFLQSAGISRMASRQHYGLALVLGGGEVSMQELATLYSMLANRGELKPLRFTAAEPPKPGPRLLSAEASFMAMDVLSQHMRPDETTGAQPRREPVYWKTGTSWAFRDAWTAGSFGPYVLVVWIGNFDGAGNPAFVGVDAASPLFFRIIDAVRAAYPATSEPRRPLPQHVKRVQVCLASGDLPNQWCGQRGWTWFIPGKSPIRVSNVHRPVVIDDATGLPACPPYGGKQTHTVVYEFWPSDLQQVFRRAGIPLRRPPMNTECADAGLPDGDPPQITSPMRASTYAMRLSQGALENIAFTANTDADVHRLYWFVNNAYAGQAAPGETFFWRPDTAGLYTVRVVDDRGRSDQRALAVTLVQ
jgi:penicillin-binding protein 1C